MRIGHTVAWAIGRPTSSETHSCRATDPKRVPRAFSDPGAPGSGEARLAGSGHWGRPPPAMMAETQWTVGSRRVIASPHARGDDRLGGQGVLPLPSRHMSDRLLSIGKTRSDSMFRKADPDHMLSRGTT